MIGATLSHFRITAKLGEGGMGEVYRAEDTKLGREVAIKVLPEAFVADEDRLARFEREARVLASLSHQGIAQIYEVGSEEDIHYLAMELAHGETLAERIARGSMDAAEALPIALQIAEALEYAHERGIVHRDLKPANVMVDGDGRVKVLDFGLARALEPESGSDSASGLTHSPTLTFRATQMGMLLGTAAYMSPEQAVGKPADRRADIWAFGVVLLEMLTGRQVFRGETVSHVLAGVLKDDPDWGGIALAVPRPVVRLVERCLRKDPRHRLQSIGDARVVLEEVRDGGPELRDELAVVVHEPGPKPRASLPWIIAGLALLAVSSLLLVRELVSTDSDPDPGPLRFELAAPKGMEIALGHQHDVLAISPDGRRQVFMIQGEEGGWRLALRDLDQLQSRVLLSTEQASSPAFSPDGEWIAFFAGTRLLKVPVAGGAPAVIGEAPGDPRGLSWSRDGYLYASPDTQMALQRIRDSGGSFEPVTELDGARRERTHRWPHVLPGGEVVLFTSDTVESSEFYDDARIEALRVASGERRVVVEQASRARYLTSGHLVFARGGSLYAAPFDAKTLEVTGPSAVVLQGVATTVASGAVHFAVSDTGTLVYVPGEAAIRAASVPVWAHRDGSQEPGPLPADSYEQLTLSPDGSRVALVLNRGGSQDLWIANLERGASTRLTFSGSAGDPSWSPDGQWVVYRDQSGIYRQRPDGSGSPELLWEGRNVAYPGSFTPDGLHLVLEYTASEAGHLDLWLLDLQNREAELQPLVTGPSADWMGQVSPDGRWLAYSSVESGRPEIYVRSMAAGGGKWQISTGMGFEPRWSPDARELFYRDQLGSLFAIAIEPGETFLPGPPSRLFGGMRTGDNAYTYSVDPDGERFFTLGLAVEQQVDRLGLILGWQDEVSRIVGRRSR